VFHISREEKKYKIHLAQLLSEAPLPPGGPWRSRQASGVVVSPCGVWLAAAERYGRASIHCQTPMRTTTFIHWDTTRGLLTPAYRVVFGEKQVWRDGRRRGTALSRKRRENETNVCVVV
jgi:hypothetical protein